MGISNYVRGLRERVGDRVLLVPSVMVATFDDQNRVLLVGCGGSSPWMAPGGSLDPEEPPADAAIRHVWGCTGLHVEPVRVVGVYGGSAFRATYANGDQVSYLMTAFAARIMGEQQPPRQRGLIQLRYFSRDDVETLELSPWIRPVLKDAFTGSERAQFTAPNWKPPASG